MTPESGHGVERFERDALLQAIQRHERRTRQLAEKDDERGLIRDQDAELYEVARKAALGEFEQKGRR